jgi:hypothetical protein
MLLTCKVQYNNFEPGEFKEIKQLDYMAAIDVIESFPWNEQRDHIQIDLTCPSVSFESSPDSILKLALYYNNKFVLHFFDGEYMYTKSFTDYHATYSHIQYFFENQSIDINLFKKENTWLKQIGNHFRTDDFVYAVSKKSLWKNIDSTTKFITAIFLIFIIIIPLQSTHKPIPVAGYIMIFFVSILYLGINYILLWNYYWYAKNKFLRISKGNDIFLWGLDPGNVKTYNKADITEIIAKKNKGGKCPWGDFTLTFIHLKDGSFIKIPSILLTGNSIHYKIPAAPYSVEGTVIPFCKLNVQ